MNILTFPYEISYPKVKLRERLRMGLSYLIVCILIYMVVMSLFTKWAYFGFRTTLGSYNWYCSTRDPAIGIEDPVASTKDPLSGNALSCKK